MRLATTSPQILLESDLGEGKRPKEREGEGQEARGKRGGGMGGQGKRGEGGGWKWGRRRGKPYPGLGVDSWALTERKMWGQG